MHRAGLPSGNTHCSVIQPRVDLIQSRVDLIVSVSPGSQFI